MRQVTAKQPEPQSAGRVRHNPARHRRLQDVFAHHQTLDTHQDPWRAGRCNPYMLPGVLGDPGNKAEWTGVRPGDL